MEKREASTELPGGIKGGGAGHKKIKYKDFLYIVLKTQNKARKRGGNLKSGLLLLLELVKNVTRLGIGVFTV